MFEPLLSAKKVVGVKQTLRAVKDGTVSAVYIALDAEEHVTQPVRTLCHETGIPVTDAPSMAELGKASGIEIGAAVTALLK